jgi:hypothetical protein
LFKEHIIMLVYCHLLNQEHQALPVCMFSILIWKHVSISDAVLWMAWIGRSWLQSSMS